MSEASHTEMATLLAEAEANANPVAPLTDTFADLDLAGAYQIQFLNVDRRLEAGEKLTGYKVGLTSLEAQKHFNIDEPDFGHLFWGMERGSGGAVPMDRLIAPKVEAELAFVLGRDLEGPVSRSEVVLAVDHVVGAIEVVDSRLADWKIKAADTIADNGSSAYYALGTCRAGIKDVDLTHVGMALWLNGEVALTGSGAAVMGDPLEAVVFLVNALGRHGRGLKEGQVILSGALSGMVPLKAGDTVQAEFLGLGSIGLRAEGEKR